MVKRKTNKKAQKSVTKSTKKTAKRSPVKKKKAGKSTKSRKKTTKKSGKKRGKKTVSIEFLKWLGSRFNGLSVRAILAEVYRIRKISQDQWAAISRGRMVRDLAGMARAGVNIHDCARDIGYPSGQALRDDIDRDPEMREAWDLPRRQWRIDAHHALNAKANEGSPQAIKAVENLLKADICEGTISGADFDHVTFDQVADLTGVSRQTVYDWRNKYGKKSLPVNRDGKTINLKVFIPWYVNFRQEVDTDGKVRPVDPLRDVKARKEEVQLRVLRGDLLERDLVMASIVAREKVWLDWWARVKESLARRLYAQEPGKMVEIMDGEFDKGRRLRCENLGEQLRFDDDDLVNEFNGLIIKLEQKAKGNKDAV